MNTELIYRTLENYEMRETQVRSIPQQDWYKLFNCGPMQKRIRGIWTTKPQSEKEANFAAYTLTVHALVNGLNEHQTYTLVKTWWQKHGIERTETAFFTNLLPSALRSDNFDLYRIKQHAFRIVDGIQLSFKTNTQILLHILSQPDCKASEIARALNLEGSLVRHQLRRSLEDGDVVCKDRRYRVAVDSVEGLEEIRAERMRFDSYISFDDTSDRDDEAAIYFDQLTPICRGTKRADTSDCVKSFLMNLFTELTGIELSVPRDETNVDDLETEDVNYYELLFD